MYKLANGAQILTLTVNMHTDGGCDGTVLAMLDPSYPGRYVTWSVWSGRDDVSELQAVNGHYFETLPDARADFIRRS